ncbi:hypothetical protein [Intestinimonas massiliensis (ex Afouda et al. 2020)]|uniref:hypothetical protein n=1 Tax=Intestinimonas massiliensis (ex Afouda et al. 2020) TaxID=1673721 RepID=UPI001030F8EB|nr:hypothetical protein [Intestinimonas massiliensis (ex Afouda et al. 2020)]
MTDNIRIRRALTKIAWAYVLLYLDFNLTVNDHALNLLPNWAGYLLIFSAIVLLGTELRSLLLLKPFCVLLGAVSGVDWLAVLLTGQELTGRFFLFSILLICVGIYFRFQMLTDLSQLAEDHGIRADSLRLCRNAEAVIQVLLMLPLPWEDSTALTALYIGLLIAGFIVCAFIIYQLFVLRNSFPEQEAPET